jgi:hypothetical protein
MSFISLLTGENIGPCPLKANVKEGEKLMFVGLRGRDARSAWSVDF